MTAGGTNITPLPTSGSTSQSNNDRANEAAPQTNVASALGLTAQSFFAGTAPVFYRVGVGALGVLLIVVGLIIMLASTRAAGDVVKGVAQGVGVATPLAAGKAIGKAAL